MLTRSQFVILRRRRNLEELKKPIIEFRNVSKVFEDSDTTVLKDINFELEEGKFYTLLGASGSGKSTILNIIAGLLDATTGDILLDGVRINDIPTNKRDVHTVFQSYALFPHMNVFENVAFPLRLRKVDKKEIEKRVLEVLKMVQLEGYEKRSIHIWRATPACGYCPCDYQSTSSGTLG